MRVAEDNHNLFPAPAKQIQAVADELSTNALMLILGHNGHRRQRHGIDSAALRLDAHTAEENVSDGLVINFGDERQQNRAFGAEVVDQTGFIGSAERSQIDRVDMRPIAGIFRADGEIGGHATIVASRKHPALPQREPQQRGTL